MSSNNFETSKTAILAFDIFEREWFMKEIKEFLEENQAIGHLVRRQEGVPRPHVHKPFSGPAPENWEEKKFVPETTVALQLAPLIELPPDESAEFPMAIRLDPRAFYHERSVPAPHELPVPGRSRGVWSFATEANSFQQTIQRFNAIFSVFVDEENVKDAAVIISGAQIASFSREKRLATTEELQAWADECGESANANIGLISFLNNIVDAGEYSSDAIFVAFEEDAQEAALQLLSYLDERNADRVISGLFFAVLSGNSKEAENEISKIVDGRTKNPIVLITRENIKVFGNSMFTTPSQFEVFKQNPFIGEGLKTVVRPGLGPQVKLNVPPQDKESNLMWRSPLPRTQVRASKALVLALNTTVSPSSVGAIVTRSLQSMNQGQLWSCGPVQPFSPGGPEAITFQASAKYTGAQNVMPISRIGLDFVCQKHMVNPQVALHMNFTDFPAAGNALPWNDSVSESIVALTALQIRFGLTELLKLPQEVDPTTNWTWESGGWVWDQTVELHSWKIDLSR